MGHGVGGVGTPWHLKNRRGYIEAAVFACGCNLRCPQCQNWTTTYQGKGQAFRPAEAAAIMTSIRRRCGVDRMAISGGESTLNRRWLVAYVRELRERNADPAARIHVDTNATLLSRDYIDELVDAGMTDIGPDLKGVRPETFMRITGISDGVLARRYLETAWDAVRYLVDRYRERVFTGVGIPYNRGLISLDEVKEMGYAIREIDPHLQVCVLDYRPEFRRRDIRRPHPREMQEVLEILTGGGLTTVICQTRYGHIGPLRPLF
jgi:pyruvate formate lyase activating enzyme